MHIISRYYNMPPSPDLATVYSQEGPLADTRSITRVSRAIVAVRSCNLIVRRGLVLSWRERPTRKCPRDNVFFGAISSRAGTNILVNNRISSRDHHHEEPRKLIVVTTGSSYCLVFWTFWTIRRNKYAHHSRDECENRERYRRLARWRGRRRAATSFNSDNTT